LAHIYAPKMSSRTDTHFMTEDNTINALSGDNTTGFHVYINS